MESYHYMELLVTRREERGRGVGTSLVMGVQGEARGLLVCVATSQATSAILTRLNWREWRTLRPRIMAPLLTGHLFTDLDLVTSFVYDKSI